MTDLHDDVASNSSANRPLADIVEGRLSRRGVLGGGLAAAAVTFLGNGPSHLLGTEPAGATASAGTRRWRRRLLDFDPIPLGFGDDVVVPPGYSTAVLIPWGDPIVPSGPAWRPDASNSAADQAAQIGMGHDGMHYFPLGRGHRGNTRGLLVVNHEFTNDEFLFPDGDADWTSEKTAKSQNAHGVSVVEIARIRGRWKVVESRRARRITARTPMRFSGPADRHPLLRTAADPSGHRVLGTANNCANGATPWGTYLTCEENFNGYFAATGAYSPDPLQARYGLTAGGFGYRWHTTDERFDLSAGGFVNEGNRFGWVVEIDPADPRSKPVKRTALGRFKHEGAFVTVGRGGRVVVYMGDDERFEYLYKFVSSSNWRSLRARGRSPLDEGTLYVARFDEDGTGDWLPLVHGEGPLTAANGFADQGEVLIKTRLAADAVGATPMDRPEWATVTPRGDCYITLTNNTNRTTADAANPRVNNRWGHIVRWRDTAHHTGTRFEWDVFLLAGPGGGVDGSTVDTADAFGSPDGLWADPDGRLWIQTDGSQPSGANDQMLAADPATGELRRFLTGVRGAEVTGVTTTPDQRTMFVNIQHPGATGGGPPNSTWPTGTPGALPRPATVVITKDDRGVIGT